MFLATRIRKMIWFNRVNNVDEDMKLEILKTEELIDSIKKIIKPLDLNNFVGIPIHDLEKRFPRDNSAITSVTLLVYLQVLRMKNSKVADLLKILVESSTNVTTTLINMIVDNAWPETFYGINLMASISRQEQLFKNTTIDLIGTDEAPWYTEASMEVSSMISSLFQTFEWFNSF